MYIIVERLLPKTSTGIVGLLCVSFGGQMMIVKWQKSGLRRSTLLYFSAHRLCLD